MTELLKQGRYVPMPFEEQVVAIFSGNEGFLDDLEVEQVLAFRTFMIDYLKVQYPELMQTLRTEMMLSDQTSEALRAAIASAHSEFKA